MITFPKTEISILFISISVPYSSFREDVAYLAAAVCTAGNEKAMTTIKNNRRSASSTFDSIRKSFLMIYKLYLQILPIFMPQTPHEQTNFLYSGD